jgi:redox-sensing transcriptional repressor
VATRLVSAGVTGLLNFAPTELRVPDHVSVRHERLTVGIMALSFKVKCGEQQRETATSDPAMESAAEMETD